jgi:hypothetical protein
MPLPSPLALTQRQWALADTERSKVHALPMRHGSKLTSVQGERRIQKEPKRGDCAYLAAQVLMPEVRQSRSVEHDVRKTGKDTQIRSRITIKAVEAGLVLLSSSRTAPTRAQAVAVVHRCVISASSRLLGSHDSLHVGAICYRSRSFTAIGGSGMRRFMNRGLWVTCQFVACLRPRDRRLNKRQAV